MNPLNSLPILIGAVTAFIVAAVIVWLTLANAHLRVQLSAAQANDTACLITNDDFRTKALQQDEAIAALNAAAQARTQQAAKAEQAAQKTVAAYQAHAAKIAKQKAYGDACAAAKTLFNTYRSGVK